MEMMTQLYNIANDDAIIKLRSSLEKKKREVIVQ